MEPSSAATALADVSEIFALRIFGLWVFLKKLTIAGPLGSTSTLYFSFILFAIWLGWKCTPGANWYDGSSYSNNCTKTSPRSVSITSIPFFLQASKMPISFASALFDLYRIRSSPNSCKNNFWASSLVLARYTLAPVFSIDFIACSVYFSRLFTNSSLIGLNLSTYWSTYSLVSSSNSRCFLIEARLPQKSANWYSSLVLSRSFLSFSLLFSYNSFPDAIIQSPLLFSIYLWIPQA